MIRPEDVTARIKYLRDERNLNNYKLSKASGISMSALSHMFSKQTIPNVTTLIKLCDGMGITLDDLFEYDKTDGMYLTREKNQLLKFWDKLESAERRELLYYLQWRSEREK